MKLDQNIYAILLSSKNTCFKTSGVKIINFGSTFLKG